MRWALVLLLATGCTELLPGDVPCCGDDAGPGNDGGSDAGERLDGAASDAGDLNGGSSDAGAPAPARLIAAGGAHSCAALNDRVVCWGANGAGQVDGSPTSFHRGPAVALTGGVAFLCAGARFTCAATTSLVSCWGANDRGQLGRGTIGPAGGVAAVSVTGSVGGLACGHGHACAVIDNDVYCWGANGSEQVTSGSGDQPAPIVTFGAGASIRALSAGASHTCLLGTRSGSVGVVVCRGSNADGQSCSIGGACGETPEPTLLAEGTFTGLAAGALFTCVLEGTTRVRCFLTDTNHPVATAAPTSMGVVSGLSAGSGFACAVGQPPRTGQAICWGQLGLLGASQQSNAFLSENVRTVAAGHRHACAIDDEGVKCWGANEAGQADPSAPDPTNAAAPTLVWAEM